MTRPNDQPLNESQLIALIEDQLDASAAARLREELADKPELLAQIDGMRADRSAMRSLPEPTLSRDLLEALEPALARPMLLAPLSAAEYRKRHRHARRPRFVRFALAAAVLLALFAGVWAASTGLLTKDNSSVPNRSEIAASHPPGAGVVDQRERRGAAFQPDEGMLASVGDLEPHERITVHHLPPPADVRKELSGSQLAQAEPRSNAGMTIDTDKSNDAAQAAFEVPFVLVIESHDLERTVALLGKPVGSAAAPVSLVRNITEQEVAEYSEMLARRAAANKQHAAPATASTDPADADRSVPAANAPARAFDPDIDAMPENLPLGAQIAGDPDRTATVEDQLRYSAAGVQYALTVPANRVAEVLMTVNLATDQASSLRTFEALDTPSADAQPRTGSPELLWVQQLRAIRKALENVDLSQARDVVIPVRIDVREAPKRR